MMAMVPYCRDMNASAPSRMALEMACISDVPASMLRTDLEKRNATTSPRTPIAKAPHR
jgi:hypothetical protein